MELIFFSLAIISSLIAVFWKRNGYAYFIVFSYVILMISSIHCLFDVVDRTLVNDVAGILDIYPTVKWVYLAMLIVISVINIVTIKFKDMKR